MCAFERDGEPVLLKEIRGQLYTQKSKENFREVGCRPGHKLEFLGELK